MKIRRLAAGTIIVAAFVALSVALPLLRGDADEVAKDAEWPEFHGPGRTNVSPDRGLLKKWPEGGPRLVWKYSNCGRGYSGVSIADGMIFTAGDFDETEFVLALDMNGRPLWKSENGKGWLRSSPGSRTTPTYSDGKLYQMSPQGRLAAFDARSGRTLWAVDLIEIFGGQHGVWGYAENVIVDGDNVLCMPGGPKGRVVALDKRTGKTVWANTQIKHTAAYCSPKIVTHDGVRQLLTLTQKSLVGVDVASGKLLWSTPFVPTSPQNALTPVYRDGYVFVACGHSTGGTLLKINMQSRGADFVWYRKDLDNCHGGALLIDNSLFGCGCRMGGKQFYCVDFLTGKTKKLDKTLGKVGISCADGMLYRINHRGMMFLLAVTPDSFEIVSQFDLGRKPSNSYLAHPVICGGRMYLRCEQDLFVCDVRGE